MGKVKGFLELDRKTFAYQPVDQRIRNYEEFVVPLSREEMEKQGARCMDCGIPFCHSGCPLGNIIPEFNDHIYRGEWQLALKNLLSTNNFPEFTGRVCPAPCESACVLGINQQPVAIKNIEASIIDYAWSQDWIRPMPPSIRTYKKVAIVGSGPAGLAAADQLNQAGHSVTVFERADRIGGLLRYGIPDFKLAKRHLDRRIQLLEEEGIVFITGAHIGVNIAVSDLKRKFDAIVLAGGSTSARDLAIPGRDSQGVHLAMQYLSQSNRRVAGDFIPEKNAILATGKNVVVLGGGDTGSDCVGTAIRQKAKSVMQIELLPMPPKERTTDTPWPLHPGPKMYSTSSSQAEGCTRDWSLLSKEFLQDEAGNLRAVKVVRLQWDGPNFKEIPGSEYEIPADLVFLALGFVQPEAKGMLADLGVEKDARGNIKCGPNYQTSVEGVFSAGDMHRGQSLVVWAISEGRECARGVDLFLTGSSRLESRNRSRCEAIA